jgi:hypothetical protein
MLGEPGQTIWLRLKVVPVIPAGASLASMRTLLREPTVLWNNVSALPPAVRSSPATLEILPVQPPALAPTVPHDPPSGLLIDIWKPFRRLMLRATLQSHLRFDEDHQ